MNINNLPKHNIKPAGNKYSTFLLLVQFEILQSVNMSGGFVQFLACVVWKKNFYKKNYNISEREKHSRNIIKYKKKKKLNVDLYLNVVFFLQNGIIQFKMFV